MDKRFILALGLMVAVLGIHQLFAPRPAEDAGNRARTEQAAAPIPTLSPADPAVSAPAPAPAAPLATGSIPPGGWASPETSARDIVVETGRYRAVISTKGGRLRSWQLKPFRGAFGEPWVELVPPSSEGGLTLTLEGVQGRTDFSEVLFACDSPGLSLDDATSEGSLVFYVRDGSGHELRHVLSFSNDSYSFGLDLQVLDAAGSPLGLADRANYAWLPGLEITEGNVEADVSYMGALALLQDGVFRATLSNFKKSPDLQRRGAATWAGLRNKYFLLAFMPRAQPAADVGFSGSVERGEISMLMGFGPVAGFAAPAAPAPPGFHPGDLEVYLGPMDLDVLSPYGVGLEQAVDLGWRWIHPLSRAVLWSMQKLHGLIPNWGITIVILSALTKLLFHPLTSKSMRSMRQMQKIQPRINELRDRYKDDPQRQQKEIMKLYQEAGVNPLGGCLPLLLQSPLFMALFNVLQHTIELRQAPFALWMNDLSSPDVLFGLPFSIPFLGNDFSLLPILMGVGMVWQQKISTPPGGGDPRMKMMGYLMPVMFTGMFYKMPSGLVLYWLVNTILSIAHQLVVNRSEKVEVMEAPPPRRRRKRREGAVLENRDGDSSPVATGTSR